MWCVVNNLTAMPPLAERLRPQAMADWCGQSHLLTAGTPLATVLEGKALLYSMVLWGPPGCGKTTLARILARKSNAHWFALSAVTTGLREVRAVISDAQALAESADTRQRVLFVDEVHHFNKTQQDAFLPHVESGLFVLIGATTENPSFELNRALLSRLVVHAFKPLNEEALHIIAQRAAAQLNCDLDDEATASLVALADGDARRLLNVLEQAAVTISGETVTAATIAAAAGTARRQFDKGGDHFYDQISALHKSVRGSDPDAALYWLCRMLDGGADPRYIARRLIRIASEDIGLADPRALSLTLAADDVYRRLGSPEGELALAQAVVYLACVSKSDAVYRAFGKMLEHVRTDGSRSVPLHLRNAPTALMKSMGHGSGYRHAHNEDDAYAAGEHYFPENMRPLRLYHPVDRGLEIKIHARLEELRRRDKKGK
ncbi:replication-associated recombination protein A [Candidatus Persebacteraceae bacterium Df01]|jgi:putative ATPase|uniref:Replication-associated recombination protein A n=1 Tax=Candidatus Doriopsillibacter californiensis TaxID=2970740 RepID=A0ABT7QL27_9GAMM|nr:replication-associated recombination protein A [Candidatus Persebacteraceae bacterium Df01]